MRSLWIFDREKRRKVREFVVGVITIVIVIGLGVGFVVVMSNSLEKSGNQNCINLSTMIRYPTAYFEGAGCLVELREGWWVSERDVINYVHLLDCGEPLR